MDANIVVGTGPFSFAEDEADDQAASSAFDREAWGLGFDSAEEAALSGYPPGEARVVETHEDAGDRVTLIVEVNPSTGYDMYEHCERREGRWYEVGHTG